MSPCHLAPLMYNTNMENKNKFEKNSKYFTITVYAVVGFLICALLIKMIFNFSQVWNAVKVVVGVLSPFIGGTVLAYLINPMYRFFDVTFFYIIK